MTKKHFIALADYMRGTKPDCSRADLTAVAKLAQWDADISALVSFCKSQNPAFNRERWIDYINGECGPNGGRVKK